MDKNKTKQTKKEMDLIYKKVLELGELSKKEHNNYMSRTAVLLKLINNFKFK